MTLTSRHLVLGRLPSRGHRRVLDEVAGRYRVEHGDLAAIGTPQRVAVLAQYSIQRRVSRSFRVLVSEFAAAGYLPLVVSASPATGELEWNGQLPDTAIVVRQPNVGYDFGSWAIGLHLLGAAVSAPQLVLANDSMLGPFGGFPALLESFERTGADVWSLTDSRQFGLHLQSYFLGFRGGILADPPLRRFWSNVGVYDEKFDIIQKNELGLSRLLFNEGYVATSAFRADTVAGPGENPVIKGWWRLLEGGFPFVKREIVRDPSVAPRGDLVAVEVRTLFGEQIEEWV